MVYLYSPKKQREELSFTDLTGKFRDKIRMIMDAISLHSGYKLTERKDQSERFGLEKDSKSTYN